ncbi:DUF1672 family protein, partial [Staphylococcus aureus]
MTFEEKLSQMYNEIANEISGMIPVEWEKVYTIAYVDDEGGEVVFNYTKPGSDELNYYTYIPREYNVSEKVAKKHRKEFEKVGEQFFKDNFGLKVKATNVVGKDDGVEVYVHCEDHGIVFNASLPLYKDAIHQKGSMRSNDNGDDMSMMVGTVLSGFEYR